MNRYILFSIVFLMTFISLNAQGDVEEKDQKKKIQLTGTVIDKYGVPLRGVVMLVDSVKTKVKTNRKGIYNITLQPEVKILTAYSKRFGLLSMKYTGQTEVNFMYTQDSKAVSEEQLFELGFKIYSKPKSDTSWYSDFATILEILDRRFYNVNVTNGRIKIGKGPNQFAGDNEPLVIVNDQQMPLGVLSTIATSDVKLIRVIHLGSEAAAYGGLKAANGVILITLK